ncbi:Hpt domain-containing protein [Thalassorhabdomicrobium marinisediminis]|uniref:Hpt domain-containing protein n=1 Tax=Thalassorhabdomicrobium marinisediminis TaxID=2170577 RepID=UPI002492BE6C|nr:Hpt domain-containing protein [Thalassorhabdomicrobium marinisediminis]
MSALAISDGLAPIRSRFLDLLDARQTAIHADLEFVFAHPERAGPALERIMADLHKIAGTSGTLGFADLGDRARRAEYAIAELLDAPSGPATPVYMLIIDVLEAALDILDPAT